MMKTQSRISLAMILMSLPTLATAADAANHPGSEFVGNYELTRSVSEDGLSCQKSFQNLSIVRNVNPTCMGLTVSNQHQDDPESVTTNPDRWDSWGLGIELSHLCRLDGGNYEVAVKNSSHGGTSHLRGKADYKKEGELSYRSKSFATRFGIPHDFVSWSYALSLSADGKVLNLNVSHDGDSAECELRRK